jgi:excisionase family DNA binding protein
MAEKKERTYTTFQIADFCNVRPTTVIKWANQSRIKAYTTPGGHRRIKESDLLDFLKKYNIPVPSELTDGGKKVLIVEDESDIGQLLMRTFQRSSKELQVQWTRDGVEGLLAVGQTSPDLVVLDVEMPLVDGARVLATLQSDPKTKNIKIIGMTGKRLEDEKLSFMRDHTDAFFFKPFKVGDLVSKGLELLKISSGILSR